MPSRVEVALPLPVDQTFTYALAPDGPRPAPGTRVLVPFHRAKRVGWVVGPGRPGSGKLRLRRISKILEEEPSLPPGLLELARWMAAYYIAPLGLVLRAALPSLLCGTGRGPGTMARTRKVAHIARWLESLAERDDAFARAPRQKAAYEFLERAAGSMALASLLDQGIGRGVVKALEKKGIVEVRDQEVVRDPFASTGPEPPPDLTPNPAQAAALRRLLSALDAPAPRPVLLHGVTASGKTLVYIEFLKEVVDARARSAIVLVPEISLTPQTVTRFRAHFGDRVAVLHSGLSDGERYDAWRQLRSGVRRIAIGARSAIFAPVPHLGAIIVDEEHEGSYKQSDAPRYHARDVAIMRARQDGALCLLGSATPSLESWSNQIGGKFELLRLPERATGGSLPPVRVVDLREPPSASASNPRNGGRPARASTTGRTVLSPELTGAIGLRLERGEQSILLLNRRGYSNFFQCRECGEVPVCADCSVSLTFHRATGRLLCHHCRYEERVPDRCRRCESRALSRRGLGTEQVERVVTESFPRARVARMDVDTTARKWAHSEILGRVGRGEVDILLGTQMIAKGLDYPRVTLVGVVDADVGLHLPDFRASERTFQLLSQVAGRAGRGTLGGDVVIQTRMPGHYAIRTAREHDYEAFAERELTERTGPGYPPHARLVNVIVTSPDPDTAATAAEEAATWVERRLRGTRVELTGPAPAPIERLQSRWRWHFLLRSPSARALGTLTRAFSTGFRPPSDARVLIDRDPMALL
ncbi:MAG: primosomal protein N' [Gammaproteobacteria bacterium]|nr:primosomal protein N' [Gammaproteobacteria bacterium]